MKRSIRFAVLAAVLVLLGLVIGPAGAQEAPESPEVGSCLPVHNLSSRRLIT